MMPQSLCPPVVNNALAAIGNTPLVYLNKVRPATGSLALKLESRNPGGSIKDRVGLFLVEDAEAKGKIHPSRSLLIEPTSGNSGIALAMVCAIKGYKLTIVMPESCSLERRVVVRSFGANLVLTPAHLGMAGACQKAEELVNTLEGGYLLDQFGNPANVEIHYKQTAPELWQQTQGNIDVLVAAVGTGGTLTGVAKFLKERNPNIKVVAVEPAESAVLSGCAGGVHGIQGIGTGFIPSILETSLIDEVIAIPTDEAMATSRRLALEEGLFSGISSGANVAACLALAQRPEYANKRFATFQCSVGERYLSSALFAPVLAEVEQWPIEAPSTHLAPTPEALTNHDNHACCQW
ncbi:MAG: cysteine synthase A [Vampirovibrionales bacterium]